MTRRRGRIKNKGGAGIDKEHNFHDKTEFLGMSCMLHENGGDENIIVARNKGNTENDIHQ